MTSNSFTSVFGAGTIFPSQSSYKSYSITANLTLVWPAEGAQNDNVVASIMDVTATAGLSVTMPDATESSSPGPFVFYNVGANTFSVKDSTGGAIVSPATGAAWIVYLTDNSTAAGTWRTFQLGAGTSSADAASLAGLGIKAITTTLNQERAIRTVSASGAIASGDRSKLVVWTGGAGTLTIAASSGLGASWFTGIRNSGTGVLTVALTGGDTIDAAASLTLNPTESCDTVTDGAGAFYTLGRGRSATFAFDYTSVNVAGTGNYTLSGAELNRIAYKLTGILTGSRNIIVPVTVQQYWVNNQTTGSFSLTVKTAAGTGVVVPQAASLILYCDGTNVIQGDTLGVGTPLPVASGGTGATTAAGARTNLDVLSSEQVLILAVAL